MKKQLVASVLLAGMAFAMPVYADDDRTPDEYNPDKKYESPLNQRPDFIVNDYRTVRTEDEDEAFAKAAGVLVQGAASGKNTVVQKNNSVLKVSTEQKSATNYNEERQESKKYAGSVTKQIALDEAEKQAEKVLSETDDNFEPVPGKEFPGYEYQTRKQGASMPGDELISDNKLLPGLKSPEIISDKEKTTQASYETVQTDKKRKKKTKTHNLPLVITGDDAQYASESGDFIIEGNVSLQQGQTHLTSTKAVGNAKTGDVWLLEGGTLQEPENRMNVHWAHYNFNKGTGELLHLKGASSPDPGSGKFDFYEAPHGIVENGMLIIDQGGTTTRCPAVVHRPCLSVKAKTITIIPNDRIIARGVQVFVKGKHIYSRDVWVNDLREGKSSIAPRLGWKSDYGYYISLDYEQPIGNPLLKNPTTFSMHQALYTKAKYKPFYSIRHDEPDFYVRLNDGYVYDSDNDLIDEGIWLHKKTDWGLFLKPHRIVKGIPLTYDASITHGLWKYTNESWSSWHTEGIINLRLDRIHLFGGKKLYLDLSMGRKWVNESLDNAVTRAHGKRLNTNIYNATIGYRFSDKWNIWETYHNEHKTSYLFSLGQPDFSREWRTGIAWTPDDRNSVTVVNRYNADSSSWCHGNYSTIISWSHRFCCEGFTVSYERKHYNHKNDWTVKFDLFNW